MGEQEHRHQEETAVLYSSEKLSMDYVTLAGINTRTGVEQRQLALFVVKELIDNALDDLEKKLINTNWTSIAGPQARIYITKGRKYVEIRVQNSNGISGFTQNTIKSIFDFGRFYSSKRNQFKISRGALGDALKEVSCIPHALADHHGIEGWNEPLTIRSGDKSYFIRLIVDKVKQTIHSEIQVKEKVHTSTTQVEVRIPNVKTLDIKTIEFLIIEYALLNPHIHFQVESKFEDVEEVNKPEQANPTIIDLPNTAEKIQAMSNLSSIYYYSPSNFHRLILGSSKQTDLTPAYDVMKELFREASNLKKDQALATLSQLKSDLSKRKDLYCKMRSVMKPKSKLDLLFDVKDRQESVKKTIECLGYEVADIKYKRKHGYYESDDGSFEFPFFFEVAIVNTTNLRRNLLYIEGINSSPQHYYQCLQGPPDTFIWQARNKKKSSSSILEMLERYGYSYDNEKCKKPRCIVIVNLISVCRHHQDIKSPHGRSRRVVISPRKYSVFCMTACDADSTTSASLRLCAGSIVRVSTETQPSKLALSSMGNPISSEITLTGRGWAKSSTMSSWLRFLCASSNSSASWITRSRIPSTLSGLKCVLDCGRNITSHATNSSACNRALKLLKLGESYSLTAITIASFSPLYISPPAPSIVWE